MARSVIVLLPLLILAVPGIFADVYKITLQNPLPFTDLENHTVFLDLTEIMEDLGTNQIGIYDGTGQELNFCYEQPDGNCNTNPTQRVWVKIPYIPSLGTVILYIVPADKNKAVRGDKVFLLYDDFETLDLNKWEVYRYRGWNDHECVIIDGLLYLTKNYHLGCTILYKNKIDYPFVVRFKYKVVPHSGADGMAFMFDKNIQPYRQFGESGGRACLGLCAYDGQNVHEVDGYAIEIDNYKNSGDPSERHIAFIRTNVYPWEANHTYYFDTDATEDGLWHVITARITEENVNVWLDGIKIISDAPLTPLGYGYVGFGAGTGGLYNDHILDWVIIRKYAPMDPVVVSVEKISNIDTPFVMHINNPNDRALINYQVRLDILPVTEMYGTKLIEIIDSEGNILDFCYEQEDGRCATEPSTIIWVKIPYVPPHSDVKLYLIPSETNNAVDGHLIFDFYDTTFELPVLSNARYSPYVYFDELTWSYEHRSFYYYGRTYLCTNPATNCEEMQIKINPKAGGEINCEKITFYGKEYINCRLMAENQYNNPTVLVHLLLPGNKDALNTEISIFREGNFLYDYSWEWYEYDFTCGSNNFKYFVAEGGTTVFFFMHSFAHNNNEHYTEGHNKRERYMAEYLDYAKAPILLLMAPSGNPLGDTNVSEFICDLITYFEPLSDYLWDYRGGYLIARKYAPQEPVIYILESDETPPTPSEPSPGEPTEPTELVLLYEVTITNPNDYALSNYQVRLSLEQSDLYLIKDSEGNTLDFCYEQANGECSIIPTNVVWVKVPYIPSNGEVTLKVYSSESNHALEGDQIFDFYDDFNGDSLDTTTKWEHHDGELPTPYSGVIAITGQIYSKKEFNYPVLVESSVKYPCNGEDADTGLAVEENEEKKWVVGWAHGAYVTGRLTVTYKDFPWGSTTGYEGHSLGWPDSLKCKFGVIQIAFKPHTLLKFIVVEEGTSASFTNKPSTIKVGYDVGHAYQDNDITWANWIRVRKYADQEVIVEINPPSGMYKVEIYNPNSQELVDYQVRVELDAAGYFKVTDTDGNPLPFCYERAGGECGTKPSDTIWVKVPYIPQNGRTIILVKYSAINYAVGGEQVFDYYDDFNDNTWSDRWEYYQGDGSVKVEDGVLKIRAYEPTTEGGLIFETLKCKDCLLNLPIVIEVGEKLALNVEWEDNEWIYMFTYYGTFPYPFDTLNTVCDGGVCVGSYITDSESKFGFFYDYPGDDIELPTEYTSQYNLRANRWYIKHIKLSENKAKACIDTNNDGIYEHCHKQELTLPNSGVLAFIHDLTDEYWINWVRVRKYALYDPIVTVTRYDIILNLTLYSPEEGAMFYTSLINVQFRAEGTVSQAKIKIYIDDELKLENLVHLPYHFNDYIEVLRNGEHSLKVVLEDASTGIKTSKETRFNLDLYDAKVIYVEYIEHGGYKYIDTLEYIIKVRCGAIGKSITVIGNFEDGTREHTIDCDNLTKTISNEFNFDTEGVKNVYFELNAIDNIDNFYFGEELFVVDLNPPTIEYLGYTLTEGFRDDLKEEAVFVVKDSISNKIECEYSFNDVDGEVVFNSNEGEKFVQFTLKPGAILEVTCKDIVGHVKEKRTELDSLVVHRIFIKEEISDAEGVPDGEYAIAVSLQGRSFTVRNTKPTYFVGMGSPPVEYYFSVENNNTQVITETGAQVNSYIRYYYITDRERDVNLYYTTSNILYETKFDNQYSEPAIGVIKLHGRTITETYMAGYGYGYVYLAPEIAWTFCVKDINGLREVCFDTRYVNETTEVGFESFPAMIMIEPLTFTFKRIGDTEYRVWLMIPEEKQFTIKVFKDNELIETIEDTLTYWEKIYNLSDTGVYKFIAEIQDYGVKSFVIYRTEGFPIIEHLTGWEREAIAFVIGLSMLGIIGLVGLSWALFTAGSIMIIVSWLLQAPYGVTLAFGVALSLIGIAFYLIKIISR